MKFDARKINKLIYDKEILTHSQIYHLLSYLKPRGRSVVITDNPFVTLTRSSYGALSILEKNY